MKFNNPTTQLTAWYFFDPLAKRVGVFYDITSYKGQMSSDNQTKQL